MTESMRPPILKPDINVPVTLTVPFGDYKEIEGQYGTQFMYNVQVDGETQTLFADVKLHQAMLTAGLAPGVTMTITKTQESFERPLRRPPPAMRERCGSRRSTTSNGASRKLKKPTQTSAIRWISRRPIRLTQRRRRSLSSQARHWTSRHSRRHRNHHRHQHQHRRHRRRRCCKAAGRVGPLTTTTIYRLLRRFEPAPHHQGRLAGF